MPPFSPTLAFVLAVITGIFGILIGLCAVALSVYWIVTGSKDRTDENMNKIVRNTTETLAILKREN